MAFKLEVERETMPTTKVNQILWLAQRVREASTTRLWFTTSGEIISGRPITSNEYYQLVIGTPATVTTPPLADDLLALRDADITHGSSHHMFNATLVDLNLVVAWGAYIETTNTYPAESGPTK